MEGFFFEFLGQWSYLGLLLVLLAAGLGLPLPEDIPLIAAGWLVHRGQADLGLMIATGLFGVLLGDTIMYAMGRRYGIHIVEHRWFRRIAKPWLLEKAKNKYHQHGIKILFAARFMPGIRAIMYLTAGVFRVPYWKFLAIDALAACISVPVWIIAGDFFGERIEDLLGGAKTATHVIIGLLLFSLVVWGIYEYYHNLRKRKQAEQDINKSCSAPVVSDTASDVMNRTAETQTADPDVEKCNTGASCPPDSKTTSQTSPANTDKSAQAAASSEAT